MFAASQWPRTWKAFSYPNTYRGSIAMSQKFDTTKLLRKSPAWSIDKLLISFLLICGSLQSNLDAQNYSWNGTSAHWHDGAAWSPFGPPSTLGTATFSIFGDQFVDWNNTTGNRSVGRMHILSSDVTFDGTNSTGLPQLTLLQSGQALLVSGPNTTFNLKDLRINLYAGSLNIRDQGTVSLDGTGKGAEINALEVNVNGDFRMSHGARTLVTNQFRIGSASGDDGSLVLESGSYLSVGEGIFGGGIGSNGYYLANLSGANTKLDVGTNLTLESGPLTIDHQAKLQVGDDNTFQPGVTVNVGHSVYGGSGGVLRIHAGSNLTQGGDASIAAGSGQFGYVNVIGGGSQWNIAGDLVVGGNGTGELLMNTGLSYVRNQTGRIGAGHNSTGTVAIGSGSVWHNRTSLVLGHHIASNSRLDIYSGKVVVGKEHIAAPYNLEIGDVGLANFVMQSGAQLTNHVGGAVLGYAEGTVGNAFVEGALTNWSNAGELAVADRGLGILTIENQATVSASNIYIGRSSTGDGSVTLANVDSRLQANTAIHVGYEGTGSLEILTGSLATSQIGIIGNQSGSNGSVEMNGTAAGWEIEQTLDIGLNTGSSGMLRVRNNGYLHVGDMNSERANTNITVGDTASANLYLNHGQVDNEGQLLVGDLSGSTGTVTIRNSDSTWNNTGTVVVGDEGNGHLIVTENSVMNSEFLNIATSAGSNGVVEVSNGGQLNNALFIAFGNGTNGILNVHSGGKVQSLKLNVSGQTSFSASVNVNGIDSEISVLDRLDIGNFGDGSISISNQGSVTTYDTMIGVVGVSNGTATVNGQGSVLSIAHNLEVGGQGNAILDIENNGLVAVGNRTSIGDFGVINVNGGRLEFGTMSWDDFEQINATSGSIAGTLHHSGYTEANSLPGFNHLEADISEVFVENTGTLFGEANFAMSVRNNSAGQIEVIAGERFRIGGSLENSGQANVFGGNLRVDLNGLNSGEINLLGGQVRFGQTLQNLSGGIVTGRGQLIADEGIINEGVLAFSQNTDILGDLNNLSGGLIVTSGGALTTFYDDVINNGSEIRTSGDSRSVFFGQVSGVGAFTGLGTVYFEGDLRPGNSPGVMTFEGDVSLGGNSMTAFELGGYEIGEHDRLVVGGNLFLDGQMSVETIDEFAIGWNQRFLIADVGGERFGMFDNVGEGQLIGNFNGVDVFLTYQGGDGNDIVLFSAVPEPGTAWVFLIAAALGVVRRKRRG